jgi:hypothetical protein
MALTLNNKTMGQFIFSHAIIGILSFALLGCEKEEMKLDGIVELYLLDSYSTLENSFQIDETTITTNNFPLIGYLDFISYDPKNYTFEISDKAKNAIGNLEHSVHGVAFSVTANGTIIYSGYFWPSYSSASCDWIVIDPVMVGSDNKITVNLGYPGLVQGHTIKDRRNDGRIIRIFESDAKLLKK